MMYRFSPSAYWSSAIRAVRFGSYSIETTRAGTPILSRFQSMIAVHPLVAAATVATEIRPLLLRPADFLSGSRSRAARASSLGQLLERRDGHASAAG